MRTNYNGSNQNTPNSNNGNWSSLTGNKGARFEEERRQDQVDYDNAFADSVISGNSSVGNRGSVQGSNAPRGDTQGGASYSNVNQVASTFWMVNAATVALRNVTVAWTLPKQWINYVGLSSVRLNLTVQNALNLYNPYPDKSWASWGGTYTRYPNLRKFTLGVNVSF